MGAFLIFHLTVRDPAKFQQYAQSVPPTLKPFKGEVALRGKVAGVYAGQHAHQAVGMLRFPDLEAATAWYRSAPYQALIPLRDEAANVVAVAYEEPAA